MPPKRLTDTACRTAKAKDKVYKLSDSEGMYLEVTPSGRKYWRLKYRFNGKEKRLALGIYPIVTLADARDKRRDARKVLDTGLDPSEEKKNEKRQEKLKAACTFELVACDWYEKIRSEVSEKYASGLWRRLEVDVLPWLGHVAITAISARQVLETLQRIEKRGAFEVVRRTKRVISQVYRHAIVTDRAQYNPVPDLQGALRRHQTGHYAALESDDIPEFLHALERNDGRLYMPTRCATKLLMLTFVRTRELIQSQWREFNLDRGEWIIPAERMKKRRAHIVPLSRQSVAILQQMKALTGEWDWVFPNQARPHKHMSNATILRALDRMGYKGRMTGHGFRALAMSTIKERLGYRHEVVDRQLAHFPRNKVDAAYDRAQFLSERRKMMQEWADYLDAVKYQKSFNSLDKTEPNPMYENVDISVQSVVNI